MIPFIVGNLYLYTIYPDFFPPNPLPSLQTLFPFSALNLYNSHPMRNWSWCINNPGPSPL